mmetsp:Transcript_24097/g.55894  ORF Transcript_24097/g.55894 Transcript_24097/m.55894 type:complete len:251 (-) Transcript_24097:275-1027(-)
MGTAICSVAKKHEEDAPTSTCGSTCGACGSARSSRAGTDPNSSSDMEASRTGSSSPSILYKRPLAQSLPVVWHRLTSTNSTRTSLGGLCTVKLDAISFFSHNSCQDFLQPLSAAFKPRLTRCRRKVTSFQSMDRRTSLGASPRLSFLASCAIRNLAPLPLPFAATSKPKASGALVLLALLTTPVVARGAGLCFIPMPLPKESTVRWAGTAEDSAGSSRASGVSWTCVAGGVDSLTTHSDDTDTNVTGTSP